MRVVRLFAITVAGILMLAIVVIVSLWTYRALNAAKVKYIVPRGFTGGCLVYWGCPTGQVASRGRNSFEVKLPQSGNAYVKENHPIGAFNDHFFWQDSVKSSIEIDQIFRVSRSQDQYAAEHIVAMMGSGVSHRDVDSACEVTIFPIVVTSYGRALGVLDSLHKVKDSVMQQMLHKELENVKP